MGRYGSYFRKLDIFFSGKQQGAVRTDQKMYSILIYNVRMVLTIFKVATSPLIFLTTRPISSLTPIETITNLMCSFCFFFGYLCNSITIA